MPQIIFLPNADHCPEGAVIEAQTGETVLDAALRNGIDIEHACEKSCACTTCHVVVREGFQSLEASDELEDDMLDKAWGLEPIPGCPARQWWLMLISSWRFRSTQSIRFPKGTEGGRHAAEME